ncbi:UTRA domain-containing protein [Micromonospora sp. WMMC241]|uniref:UTRA domain-containing protein n=1 Tax=Micromonospora sp. WMMC241 TaxID=3015159 RepID=UPI0022B641FB|nr:UTRA domain-containing protein [Micromonospora sp. WMMC241]MCZ7440793.1 UTRA domain-containing protein [Micromonospora sp. WMMC241]MCZ7440880.1 UTRA domain-containing protein [Micromonospora sp. WMMC241]
MPKNLHDQAVRFSERSAQPKERRIMGQPRWTTTSDQYLNPTTGDAWAAEAAEAGQQGSQRILDANTTYATAEIAAHLALEAEHPAVVMRRRVILADGEPVEIAASYWPAAIAEATILAQREKIPGGAARFLAEIGYTPSEVREDVTARMSTPFEQVVLQGRNLRLTDPEPVLVLTRILLDHTGQPYQVDINVMRAGRHIRYVRKAG